MFDARAILDMVKFHAMLSGVFDFLVNIVSLIQMLLHWRFTLSCLAAALLGFGLSSLIPNETFSAVVFVHLILAGVVVGFVWDHRSTQDR